jgi:C-terminal processing protease CtpA/Prc
VWRIAGEIFKPFWSLVMRISYPWLIAALLLASCAPTFSWAGDGGYFDWGAAQQNAVNNQRHNAAMDALTRIYGPTAGAPAATGQALQNYRAEQTMQANIAAGNMAPQKTQADIALLTAQAALLNAQTALLYAKTQKTAKGRQQDGRSNRPLFGVTLNTTDVSPEGLAVVAVRPGEAADRAGIEEGDIILAYGGKPMSTPRDLQIAVNATKPGETKNIEILRNSREMNIAVSF